MVVIMQHLDIHRRVQTIALNLNVPNSLVWRWTSSSQYLASSTYVVIFYDQSTVGLGCKGGVEDPSAVEVQLLPLVSHPW
jgi:hypothetical protein